MAPTVSFYWQGALTLYERACLASFVARGFEVDLYSFAPLAPPPGVRLRDAGEVLDASLSTAFTQGGIKGSPTAFSNLFRYELLARHGGIWMDCDVFCLRPLADYEALIARAGERTLMARERDDSVNSAIMMSRAGSPLLRDLLATAWTKGFEIEVWGTLGPKLVTEFANARPAEVELLEIGSFYPVEVSAFALPLLPEGRDECEALCRESYGLHLWNNIYRHFCMPKNILPPQGSFMYERIRAVLGDALPPDYPALPAETVRRLLKGSQAIERLKQIKQQLADKLTQILKEV